MLPHYCVSIHVKISFGLNIYHHNTAVTANITSALERSALIKCPSFESLHQNLACRSTFLHWITKMVSLPVRQYRRNTQCDKKKVQKKKKKLYFQPRRKKTKKKAESSVGDIAWGKTQVDEARSRVTVKIYIMYKVKNKKKNGRPWSIAVKRVNQLFMKRRGKWSGKTEAWK